MRAILYAVWQAAFPLRALFVSLRPHQWVKNLLVFGGLIFSQSLGQPEAVLRSLGAFVAFCLASSAVYLLNDLCDLQEDRRHPVKKHRPLAAGEIGPRAVVPCMLLLAAAGIAGGFAIAEPSGVMLTLYVLMNVAYTRRLKHVVILDVMLIGLGFVLRAIAGAAAIGVPASPWLVLCTLTLALLIGFGKRRHELLLLQDEAAGHRACLEHYSPQFLDLMMTISAAAAIVCYALYTMAADTATRIGSHGLVLTTPFVMYGIFRYLFLVHQCQAGGDPARLFLSDAPTVVNAALWVLTACLVVYGPKGWLVW